MASNTKPISEGIAGYFEGIGEGSWRQGDLHVIQAILTTL